MFAWFPRRCEASVDTGRADGGSQQQVVFRPLRSNPAFSSTHGPLTRVRREAFGGFFSLLPARRDANAVPNRAFVYCFPSLCFLEGICFNVLLCLQSWPGLPRGVEFNPSDGDLLWHLAAEVGNGQAERHPFINKFITSVVDDREFSYTHPRDIPGM